MTSRCTVINRLNARKNLHRDLHRFMRLIIASSEIEDYLRMGMPAAAPLRTLTRCAASAAGCSSTG